MVKIQQSSSGYFVDVLETMIAEDGKEGFHARLFIMTDKNELEGLVAG